MVEQRFCKPFVAGSNPVLGLFLDVVQFGSMPVLGTGGRGFKSLHPDHFKVIDHLKLLHEVVCRIP